MVFSVSERHVLLNKTLPKSPRIIFSHEVAPKDVNQKCNFLAQDLRRRKIWRLQYFHVTVRFTGISWASQLILIVR